MQGGPITNLCFSEGDWSLAMCGLELLSHPLLNCKLAEDWVCPGSLGCPVRPAGNSCGCVSFRETLSLGPVPRCCCIFGVYLLESSVWAYKHQELNFLLICCCSSVAKSFPTLRHHGRQYTRPPCPSPSPRVCPSSYLLSQ